MMISKTTFVAIVSMLMKHIDDKKELLECSGDLPEECKECIMEETELQKDLITMLTVVTFDHFGVIRDYLYERDENDEYFFGIPKGNKIEVYLTTSAEDLYEYLSEESEGFCLIAKKRHPDQLRSWVQKSLQLSKKISSPSNGMLEKPRRIVICGGDQFRHVLTYQHPNFDTKLGCIYSYGVCFL